MKFVERKPLSDPDVAARKLVEIANGVDAVRDGRIYIERVNAPFLAAGGTGDDFRTGIERAIPTSINRRKDRCRLLQSPIASWSLCAAVSTKPFRPPSGSATHPSSCLNVALFARTSS